jgi:iron complex outermembrane recepter protein
MIRLCPSYLLALLLVIPLYSTSSQAASLEEIVVYARKTDENKQTVPISIIVNTGEDLERSEIVQFTDLAKVTPGLNIVSDDPTSTSMKIRGVGLPYFGLAADPGVVVIVDEFPQSRIGSVFGAFMDISQVEVLKGPQGTLYGRNAPSGVISVRTKQPDHEGIHGRVDVSSSSFNTFTGEAAINLPLVDDLLAMRVAYLHNESDGYVNLAHYENDGSNYIFNGVTEDADHSEGDNARATLLFEPLETLSILGRYNYSNYDNGQLSSVSDGPMIFTPTSAMLNPDGSVYVADRDDNLMFQDFPDYSNFKLKEWGLKANWTTDAGELVSLSQFQDFKTELSETIDAQPLPHATPRVLTSTDELISQELRWHSTIGDDIHYLVGAFYAEHDITISYEQLEQLTGQLITVHGDQENLSFAVFGSVDYAINDQYSLSVGARYNEEEETIDGNLDLSAILGDAPGINIGNLQDKTEDDNTSFSFKFRYQRTDSLLFYFAWDTAYKSSGYNPQLANTSAPGSPISSPNIALLERDLLQYPAEESEAFEVGMKSVWLDSKLLVNIALFYQEFDDFQNFQGLEPERIGGFSLGSLINAVDEVVTQGIELETHWVISDAWNLSFTSSYADATTDDWQLHFCDEDDNVPDSQLYCPLSDGARLNDDPKWTTSTQLDFRSPIANTKLTFFSHLTFAYRAEAGGDNDTSRGVVDLNAGVEKNNWSVKVWSKNLLDEKEFDDHNSDSDDPDVDNFFIARNLQPRSIGITAIYSFGE